MARRQRENAAAQTEKIGGDKQGACVEPNEGGENAVEIALARGVHGMDLLPGSARSLLYVFPLSLGIWIVRINEHADHSGIWDQLVQQFKSLCPQRSDKVVHARAYSACMDGARGAREKNDSFRPKK
jgi:hypothetical protein